MQTKANAIAATPIGMFRKKIHRQPTLVTMNPPRVGPSSTPSPDMMPVAAKAGPRLAAGRIEVMMRQPLRREQRRSDALQGPEGDQLARRLGQPGGQAGRGEHGQAEQEKPSRAMDVAESCRR